MIFNSVKLRWCTICTHLDLLCFFITEREDLPPLRVTHCEWHQAGFRTPGSLGRFTQGTAAQLEYTLTNSKATLRSGANCL